MEDYTKVSEDEFSPENWDELNNDRDHIDTDALGNCFSDADPGL